MILGTYRDVEVSRRHPLSDTLGSVMREQGFLRVQLSGLAESEVEQLIDATASARPPSGVSTAIHQRTEGNPLFVTEIVKMLPSEGLEEVRAYLTSIPEGVRDAIGRRLNRLSEGCVQTLTMASVVGREFHFALLSSLMDEIPDMVLLELVEEALEAHVIEELPEGRERYRFSHALVQQTLLGELSASRRVRLHARIAEALEGLYGANFQAHSVELAYHFAESETVLGPEKLVQYSRLSGERALAAYAWEEALVHFERALAAKEGQPMGAEKAALLFGLGRAQTATQERYQREQVFNTVRPAFDYYMANGDLSHALAIAAYPFAIYQGGSVNQILSQGLAVVASDSYQAAPLLARYGQALSQELVMKRGPSAL